MGFKLFQEFSVLIKLLFSEHFFSSQNTKHLDVVTKSFAVVLFVRERHNYFMCHL